MKKIIVLLCSTTICGFAELKPLKLEQALELARSSSPELRAAHLQLQSAEKGMNTAGLWKNPTLVLDAEGVGWDNDLFSQGEYTVGVSQEFQRGAKQKKERTVAAKAIEVSIQIQQEKELQLAVRVHQAFVEVVVQQESAVVRMEQVELATEFLTVAKRRYEAGSNSELDVVQAEVALEEARLLQSCCWGDLQAAREVLASLVGLSSAELPEVEMPYYTLANLDGLAVDDSYPGLQRLEAEADRIRRAATLAKAQDTPNVSLGAGYRYEAVGEINTLVFSAAMPLSFHKRGRAEYAVGMLEAEVVLASREELHRKLRQELARLLALYGGAKMRVEISQDALIPFAQKAFEVSRKGYEMGRFSWLELISAQQKLAEIRIGYIGYLRDAHLIHAQLSKFMKEGI